ncbi:MAG TPA: ribosomal protein S18-alanine N-acetyltransferase [Anaerolineaceae bacterium]
METSPHPLTIHYRPMTLQDVPRVHEIDTASFSLPWSERSYRFELVENKNSVCWVAEVVDGKKVTVAGMIVIWAIIDEAHVATIAVHPDFRGLGIGRTLLARGLFEAYLRGARLAFLEVRRGNLVAQQMYRKFGFQVVGERPRYYQDNNEDALLMTLEHINPAVLEEFSKQPDR